MKVAIWGTQPPKNQPDHGPKTREIHTKTPPQSGISRLRSRKAKAVNRIGTNPRRNAAGVLDPTARTTKPKVTARLYAGATAARPSATVGPMPIEPAFSPLLAAATGGVGGVTVGGGRGCDTETPHRIIVI
jgi:hypothetical protein